MSTASDAAVNTFSRHFNCSQAVFSTFAPRLGLDEATALKLASPFGAGMARRGEVCGAVTGSLLTLGLSRGAETPAGKEEIYRLSQEFMRRFEEKHGTLLCRELIGCDISTPAGHQAAVDKQVFVTICPVLVREAVEIVEGMLEMGRL